MKNQAIKKVPQVMQVHENMSIDTTTPLRSSSCDQSSWKKNAKNLILITSVFICSIVATGLIVYNFVSCPDVSPQTVVPISSKLCEHHFGSAQSSEHILSSAISSASPTSTTTATSTIFYTASTTPITSTDKEEFDVRLPRAIKPHAYDIKLIPYMYNSNFTFDGVVSIIIEVIEENTKNITLHAASIQIVETNVQVKLIKNNEDQENLENKSKELENLLIIKNLTVDDRKQFLIINFDEKLLTNRFYEIKIKYQGILNDYLQGFYRSSYTKGNETKWLAATQFQPTDARRAFPCFDEPALKAKFNISIARPKNLTSISNMPRRIGDPPQVDGIDDYVWDIYEESVPMSTYLVAFVVSDFVKQTSGNFSVWTRSDATKSAKYALEVGPKILKYLETFFGIDFPLPKIDMIALPDFSAGAMENWGLITYRETAMLYDEGVSAHSNKQRVATVVSHELAHQWFGNLVTPSWWSDLWLNEGFASYMEYLGVDAVEPTWKTMDQFVVEELQNVFALDALSSSHQISVKVGNPDEINEIFDRISYGKGATIIRMMDHFLTPSVFRQGLTNFLNGKAYQSADQDDLWAYLTEEARATNIFDNTTSVKEIMDTWTLQTGFPVVEVHRNYEKHAVSFKQERFVLIDSKTNNSNDPKENPIWWIPLTYTSSLEMGFNNTKPTLWMRGEKQLNLDEIEIQNDHWMIVNIQQTGYYRVNYDQTNWNMIVSHLRTADKYKNIATSNRAQLIDDALNLARGGFLSYDTALDVTRYLKHETEYVPWKSAINALNYIDSMLMKGGDYFKFKMYFLELLEKVYKVVGFEDVKTNDILTIFKRVDILSAACHLGYKDCIYQSVMKYHSWMNNPDPDKFNPISPNLKNLVYCTAIKNGNEAEWDFAWERYHATTISSEKETLLSALGCSREIWILTRYLERSMNDTYGIRKQDVFRVFGAVSNNILGQPIAFNYIRSNWKMIKEYLGASILNVNTIIKYSTRRLNNRYDLDELKRFADIHLKDGGRTIQQAIERAESNIDWMNKNYKTIVEWLSRVVDADTSSLKSIKR